MGHSGRTQASSLEPSSLGPSSVERAGVDTCFGDEFIVQLADGLVDVERGQEADAHMDVCDRCRRLVAQAARGSTVPEGYGTRSRSGLFPVSSRGRFSPGDTLAHRYEIKAFLGHGAMGMVYHAHDQTLDVDIAVKVLTSQAASSGDALRRLRREIVLGRRVTHPNVCRVYDLGEHDGAHFITMEYLEGETLRAHMAQGPLGPWKAWTIIDQVGEALEVAHTHGIVHRDLKPENIMIGANLKVTVMDFGLAMDLNAESQTQARVGTPAYWSPEQARGEPATMASDIYSMAVIYCELLGGGRPRWGEAPNLLNSGKPFEPIAKKCLSVDPAKRYDSLRACRKDLDQAWLQMSRTSQKKLRYWFTVRNTAVALAATATLGLLYWWLA